MNHNVAVLKSGLELKVDTVGLDLFYGLLA